MWHEEFIAKLSDTLIRNQDVKGLLVFGSCAGSDVHADAWSDIDIAVVVEDSAINRYHPAIDWAEDLGTPYVLDTSETEGYRVLRLWFTDGRHLDAIIITEHSLDCIDGWSTNPLQYGFSVLFSRSPALDRALSGKFPPPTHRDMSYKQFSRLVNDFYFKGMLAVTKAARNELLIAVHLSLDMVRDCLVLGMALRDRETGTNHHRNGARGNHFVKELDQIVHPYTAESTLACIEESAKAFDRLASKWDSTYTGQREPLLDFVVKARRSLHHHTDI